MITVDTHAIVKTLVANGFTENEAESMLLSFSTKEETKQLEESVVKPSEFREAINKLDSSINKLDNRMSELTKDLRHDMANFKNELKLDIAKTKNEILYWMIPFFLTNVGLIVTIILKLLVN